MKTKEELKPNFGPVYAAALYPRLCSIFQKHGYALAVHGSVARDFDLIAVPWAKRVSPREVVLAEAFSKIALRREGEPVMREHGRIAYSISIGFGECACDLSFLPMGPDQHLRPAMY